MKQTLLISIAILISTFAQAKNLWNNDTTLVELITFESESVYFRQGTPTDNIWQIGQPSKTNFSAAYSAPNAIVTDKLNAYPANNHSWFDIVLYPNEFAYTYRGIEFMHKVNTDTLADGGFITVSYDQGATWLNIIDDSAQYHGWETTPNDVWSNENLYSLTDTLSNGSPGFSGFLPIWTKVRFSWYYSMYVKNQWYDTMLVRFNFISDASENVRDGWMIDNIRIFYVDLGGNIHDKPLISNLEIYPNPIQTNSIIRSKDQKTIQQILIYNLAGQLLKTSEIKHSEFTFEREGLPPGSYLLKCLFEDNASETIKIILN